jgi:hypothetical protein
MKKAISLLMTAVMFTAFSISAMGKSLSVGYVLVGPKNDGGWSMRHHQGFQSLKNMVIKWQW